MGKNKERKAGAGGSANKKGAKQKSKRLDEQRGPTKTPGGKKPRAGTKKGDGKIALRIFSGKANLQKWEGLKTKG